MRYFNKIDVLKIISNHLDTLKNFNSKKHTFDDVLTFMVLPLVVASLFVYLNIKLTTQSVGIVITILSILVGLMFNVIVILFDIIKRDSTSKIKNQLLKELLTNISYSILIAIIIILFSLFTYFNNIIFKMIITGLVIFFLTHYFFTVLMILKRMYSIFINEINEIEDSQKV